MNRLPFAIVVVSLSFAVTLAAQAAAPPAMEKRPICGPESAPQWSATESSMASSTSHTKTGSTALHWHVAVDYFAGEAKYPVGWPRVHFVPRDVSVRNWSEWDFLLLRIHTDTSREKLPAEAVGLGLHVPDRANAYHRPLQELKKGEWVEIRIPLSEVPRRQDVRLMQFHISESNYRHQDQLDLYFDEIALERYAEPTLLDFAPENSVLFADMRFIPVRFQLLGVKPDATAEVACELRRNGQVAGRTTATATRGPQRVAFEVSRQPLSPGEYELTAQVAGSRHPAQARLRLIESPWK